MCISNLSKSKFSYKHKEDIKRLFNKNVEGFLHIKHFSVNVFTGNGENLFLSNTPKMAEVLCKNDLVNHDSNYKPSTYKRFSIYPWCVNQKNIADQISHQIKTRNFKMRYGTMFVRHLGGGKYVMYSIATHRRDMYDRFYFLYHAKANDIMQMGDAMYNELLPIINELLAGENIEMPKINTFKPLLLERHFDTVESLDMYDRIKDGDVDKLFKNPKHFPFRVIRGGRVDP